MADRFLASLTAAVGTTGSSGDSVSDRGTPRRRGRPPKSPCQSPRSEACEAKDSPRTELDPVFQAGAPAPSADKGSVRIEIQPQKAACNSPRREETDARDAARDEIQAVEQQFGWESKSDPTGPLFSLDGAAVSDSGQLRKDAYLPFKEHFYGEAQDRKDHPDERFPGLRAAEVAERQQNTSFLAGLRMWCDANGAGWIAFKPGGKKTTWISMKTWGSWRLAYLLAKLQRDLWQREVENAEKAPGDRAILSASPSASPRASPSASPRVSPSASPRASPRASPFASPSASPLASPSASRSLEDFMSSPCLGPQASTPQCRTSKTHVFSSPSNCKTWGLENLATPEKDSKRGRSQSPLQASTPQRHGAQAPDCNFQPPASSVQSPASSLQPLTSIFQLPESEACSPDNLSTVKKTKRSRSRSSQWPSEGAEIGSSRSSDTLPSVSLPKLQMPDPLVLPVPHRACMQACLRRLRSKTRVATLLGRRRIRGKTKIIGLRLVGRRRLRGKTKIIGLLQIQTPSALTGNRDRFRLGFPVAMLSASTAGASQLKAAGQCTASTASQDQSEVDSKRSNVEDSADASQMDHSLTGKQLGASDSRSGLDPEVEIGNPAGEGSVQGRGRPRNEDKAKALLDWLALLALVANTLQTPDGRARFKQLLHGKSETDVQLLVRKLRREEKNAIAEEVLRIFEEMRDNSMG